MKKIKNGFSLIELLVVISIIGVLTAVLMMNLVGARERARDSQKIQDLNNLKSALRMYYNDNQSYPPTATGKSIIVGIGFTGYAAGLGDTSFEYTQRNGGDGFLITIGLESGAGRDDTDSQTKCGIVPPVEGTYAVCAN